MSTETEIKIKIQNPEEFCELLSHFNPRVVSSRHFEDNYLLDFDDKSLQASGGLIRIRYAGEKALLTYKGPSRAGGIFKTREEIETELKDGIAALQILEKLGMRVWFRYQKYRREYDVKGVLISVDETPIGDYAEIEGSEKKILDFTDRIGIATSRFLRQSYYSLHIESCRLNGKNQENMVF